VKKVAVYLRVSSEEQKLRETILNQRIELEKFCEDQGYEPIWYEDNGVSGDVPFAERPAGANVMVDARAGRFGKVIVWKIDRLSRRTEDVLRTIRVLHEEFGLDFRCASQDFEVTSSTGRMQLGLMALFAEFEKSQILERTRLGLLRFASNGKWPAGRPSFGLHVVEGFLEPNPIEAPIVQLIFRLYLDGMGMRRIAEYLQANGIPTPCLGMRRGKGVSHRWRIPTVAHILHNEVYKGTAKYNRTRTVRKDGRRVGTKKNGVEDHVIIPVAPIIDPDLWDAAQEQCRKNTEANPRNRKRPYPLAGKVFCGCCGRRFCGAVRSSGRGHEYRIYKCGSDWGDERGLCPNARIRADFLELAAWERVKPILRDPEPYLDRIRQRLAEMHSDGSAASTSAAEFDRLDNGIAELEAEEKRVKSAHRKGIYTDEELSEQLTDIREQLAVLRRERLTFEKEAETPAVANARLDRIATILELHRGRLEMAEFTPELWEEILREVVLRVDIHPAPGDSGRRRVRPRVVLTTILAEAGCPPPSGGSVHSFQKELVS
jgi:site-specific DNA recombinase